MAGASCQAPCWDWVQDEANTRAMVEIAYCLYAAARLKYPSRVRRIASRGWVEVALADAAAVARTEVGNGDLWAPVLRVQRSLR